MRGSFLERFSSVKAKKIIKIAFSPRSLNPPSPVLPLFFFSTSTDFVPICKDNYFDFAFHSVKSKRKWRSLRFFFRFFFLFFFLWVSRHKYAVCVKEIQYSHVCYKLASWQWGNRRHSVNNAVMDAKVKRRKEPDYEPLCAEMRCKMKEDAKKKKKTHSNEDEINIFKKDLWHNDGAELLTSNVQP